MSIESFKDLTAWKESHKFVIELYKATRDFPKEEIYGLTNQLRRAVVSIVSNIVEGFSKKSRREKIQFYHTALGSLLEVQSQLLIAKDLGYLSNDDFNILDLRSISVRKLILGLMKSACSV